MKFVANVTAYLHYYSQLIIYKSQYKAPKKCTAPYAALCMKSRLLVFMILLSDQFYSIWQGY